MPTTALLALLDESFGPEPHPGEAHIVHNNSGYDLEAVGIREAFKAHTWQTLPAEVLLHEQSALGFLSPAGFKYYLPAYLRLAVQQYEAADMIPDNLVLALTLPTEADIVLSALDIRRYGMDEDMPGVDWNDILQNRLRNLNRDTHDFIDRHRQFSRAQGQAIYQFLVFLRDEHGTDFLRKEPEIAIERYWFQFA
jgi:hypothetical protein